MTLEERLDLAEKKISEPDFRRNKGLANEVGYYIFDYPADRELTVREWVKNIAARNAASQCEYRIVVFDVYEIIIQALKEKGYLDQCCEFEKSHGMPFVVKAVGAALRFADKGSYIVNYIIQHTPTEKAIVFLTGIGKCYPLLRSHMLLNNLHQKMDVAPVVLFFPGKYDGQEPCLFSTIKDGNYYRAFKLVD